MNRHRFPPAIDIALPSGGLAHIEFPQVLTPYELIVNKVVRFVAGPELELDFSFDELDGLSPDEQHYFDFVLLRRCKAGEFVLEYRPHDWKFKLRKATP